MAWFPEKHKIIVKKKKKVKRTNANQIHLENLEVKYARKELPNRIL